MTSLKLSSSRKELPLKLSIRNFMNHYMARYFLSWAIKAFVVLGFVLFGRNIFITSHYCLSPLFSGMKLWMVRLKWNVLNLKLQKEQLLQIMQLKVSSLTSNMCRSFINFLCWFFSCITVKGVPDFWLTAMKNHELLAEEVREYHAFDFSMHVCYGGNEGSVFFIISDSSFSFFLLFFF